MSNALPVVNRNCGINCYNCSWLDTDRGFCHCPKRGATSAEAAFSEITAEAERLNLFCGCQYHSHAETDKAFFILGSGEIINASNSRFEHEAYIGEEAVYYPEGTIGDHRSLTGKFINNGEDRARFVTL